jgi:hypothetical protein
MKTQNTRVWFVRSLLLLALCATFVVVSGAQASARDAQTDSRLVLNNPRTSSLEQLTSTDNSEILFVQGTRSRRYYDERGYYDGRRYYGRRNYYSPYRYRGYYFYGPGYYPRYYYRPQHGYYYEYRYEPPDYRPYFRYNYYYDGPGVRIEIGPRGYYYRYQ